MRKTFRVAFTLLAAGGWTASARAADPVAVVAFDEAAPQRTEAGDEDSPEAPSGAQPRKGADRRYRFQNGRWWYLSRDNQWLLWNGTRWMPYQRQQVAAQPASGFNAWFNAYRGVQVGRGRLRTAEAGQVEMATSQITPEGEAAEAYEVGGIPRRQARRPRAGVGRTLSGSGAWFNAGSPFGIRYGYGSGFGYGGYGFDNPYGYGSRTGSGGAYGYGFGEFGSVGGQTGERLSSLISGGGEEGGRLIGPEPPGIGAPARLESSVGGTYGKAGAGARQLGGSASEGGRD